MITKWRYKDKNKFGPYHMQFSAKYINVYALDQSKYFPPLFQSLQQHRAFLCPKLPLMTPTSSYHQQKIKPHATKKIKDPLMVFFINDPEQSGSICNEKLS